MRRTCFYHAGCPDGFGAAWAVWRAWGDEAAYVARGHDDRARADELEGDLVAFVDIAPDNDELLALGEVAAQVIVLDHHVSNIERLQREPRVTETLEAAGHHLHFDLSHSGAVLAWRHFHPEHEVPELLRYVEDQDLWNWALPRSEEVNAAIAAYPRRFDAWEAMAERGTDALAEEGAAIVRANRMEVERIVQHAAPIRLGTERIEAVNSTAHRAQVGHELATRKAFGKEWGCVFRIVGDRVHATLYSVGDLDVAAVATSLGGGGHRNAAGFSVPLERWVDEFVV